MHTPQHVDQPDSSVLREPEDGIGTEVWPASRVMLSWLASATNAPQLSGKTVLELGSGTGALAMAMVASLGVCHVFASEGDTEVLNNLCFNVASKQMGSCVTPCLWDWGMSLEPPTAVIFDTVDLVIASDVVYVGTEECRLSHALANLCRPEKEGLKRRSAWLCLADRPLGGEQFAPAPDLDEGVDPSVDSDSRPLSAVGRFLHACARRQLHVEEFAVAPELIEAATMDAGCIGGRREFEGRIAMYHVQDMATSYVQ